MITFRKTNCIFCSLGCGLIINVAGNRPLDLDYDVDNPVNGGALCPRGNYMLELLNNPARLSTAKIREDHNVIETDSRYGAFRLAQRLRGIVKDHGARSVGVVFSPNLFNEDIISGYKFFSDVVGTSNIDVAFPMEDSKCLIGDHKVMPFKLPNISPEDLSGQDALFIIGDVLERSAVISRRINDVKYGKKGTKIIVVDPQKTRTSWFATAHIRPRPGTEAHLMFGLIKCLIEDGSRKALRYGKYFAALGLDEISKKTGVSADLMREAARQFSAPKKGAVIISSGMRDDLLCEMSKLFAYFCDGEKGVVTFYSSGNAIGAFRTINALRRAGLSYADMIEGASRGKLKALVLFGVDVLRASPHEKTKRAISGLELLAVADYYRTAVMDYADIILPLGSPLEAAGSMTYSAERTQSFKPVSSTVGGLRVSDILSELGNALRPKKRPEKAGGRAAEAKKKIRSFRSKDKIQLTKLAGQLRSIKMVREDAKFPFLLCLKDDIVHSSDGSITSRASWASREAASPYVNMSEEDARALKIADGDRVLVKTPRGELIMRAAVSGSPGKGTLFCPHHFQEVRELVGFDKNLHGGYFISNPQKASVEKMGMS